MKDAMRIQSTIYRVLVIILSVGVTLHIFVLILDLWSRHQNEIIAALRAFESNNTAEMTKARHLTVNDILKFEKAQGSWKSHIKRSCEKLGFQNDLSSISRDMLYRTKILVDDKHKLLYCQVAKVASTTWRRIFILLSGKENFTNPMSINANDAHHKYDKYLTYLSDLSRSEIIHRLQTYFKFVFVREPFGRLLSAFRNKFVVHTNASSYFQQTFGKKIIKRYRRRPPVVNNGTDVTFLEFVNYLTDTRRKIQMNEHWEKFHELCYPCVISYDFIGKLETFTEDSQYILEKKSLSEKVRIPSRSESRYKDYDTNSYLTQYYSVLPRAILKHLYKAYKADFVIFNYTVPEIIKHLM